MKIVLIKPESESTKIIMISSEAELPKRLAGYESGVDDFLQKPFKPEELEAKIRVFLRLKNVEEELKQLNLKLNRQVEVRTRQLLGAERLAAIGKHAAGIVHNLNNPLQTVLGIAQLSALEQPENERFKSLNKAALEMKNIITTILRTTHRNSAGTGDLIDINQVVKDQVDLLKADQFFRARVNTNLVLGPTPPIYGRLTHFNQSLGNLIKNASDAMFNSQVRTLSVETRRDGSNILIIITDTGSGIPEHLLDKIFDPFFTTKPVVAKTEGPTGTGLGLATCKEMISSYGGTISVSSNPNKGTTFTVSLPIKPNQLPTE